MCSLYALHLSLSVAIPAIQPRLRLSGSNRLRSAFHGAQRGFRTYHAAEIALYHTLWALPVPETAHDFF
ncbi:MAG: hypothetical protein KZQ63_02240 [Candidatus Thiodiazotropha sp. (ex Lucinoma aequizonata)]|nr:hypothetical protein [Candidatus Thiodiazotropha sp. (ex Lucinoma aequizonata)]